MICKSRKSKGIIRDNVTEKRFFTKNSFNFRLELSTRILKAILTTTVLFSYHSYATCLPQQCYFLTTAVVRLLLSIKRDSFRRYRGNLKRYAEANKELVRKGKQKDRVVFMGNSITEGWVANDAAFFEDNGYVGRGIGGQTSSHFLLRFREDVIKLAPALVVINAGTNDIAENAGAYNEEYTFGNIVSMVELARANKIKVILTSVLPAAAFGWNPSVKDAPQKIMQLNARIRKYAQENKIPYVDYYSEMVEGDNKTLNSSYTRDGVHPTLEGYKVMEALIKKAIDKVL